MPDNLTDEAKQALSKSGFFVYDQYKDEFKELPFFDPYDQTVAVFIKDNGRMAIPKCSQWKGKNSLDNGDVYEGQLRNDKAWMVNMCIRMALNIWDIGKKMSRMEMGKKHCQMVLIMKENIRMGKNLAKENFNLLMDLYMLVNSIQIIFMAKEFINERTTESMQENVPMTNFINNQIYISENQIDNLYKKKYQHGCQQRENQFNSNRND